MELAFAPRVIKIERAEPGTCLAFRFRDRTCIGIAGIFGELSQQRRLIVALGPPAEDGYFPRVFNNVFSGYAMVIEPVQLLPSIDPRHMRPGSTNQDLGMGWLLVDEDNELHLTAGYENVGLLAINVKNGTMVHADNVRTASWFSAWKIVKETPGAFVEVLNFPTT